MAENKKFSYGGQAVIEGVMIRGRKSLVTAIRRPGGDIVTEVRQLPKITTGRLRRIPLIRGMVVLIEAMVLGIQSLMFSANVAIEQEKEEIPTRALWIMVGAGAALMIALFIAVPLFLTNLINPHLPNSIAFNAVEGAIRLVIFLGYLKLISLMRDIQRGVTSHGAEAQTVNAT